MNKENLVVAGVVLALVFSSFAAFFGGVDGIGPKGDKGDKGDLGGAAGPTKTETQQFLSNFSSGSVVTSTTTVDATITLDSTHLRRDVSLMSWDVGVITVVTTMASTSAPLVGLKPGEWFTVYFHNASTTAASQVTFAEGTGVDIQEDNGGVLTVGGNDIARLTFLKKADTDVILWIESAQEG